MADGEIVSETVEQTPDLNAPFDVGTSRVPTHNDQRYLAPQAQVPGGLWTRVKNFIFRRKPVGVAIPASPVQQELEIPEWPVLDPKLSPSDQLKSLQALRSEITKDLLKTSARHDFVLAKWNSIQDEIEHLVIVQDELSTWNLRNQNTFASLLLRAMRDSKAKLVAEVTLVRGWLSEEATVSASTIEEPRIKFVQRIRRIFVFALIFALIAFLTSNTGIGSAILGVTVIGAVTLGMFIVGAAIVATFLSLFSALFSYYRNWSVHIRRLDIDLAKARDLSEGVAGLRNEKMRLEGVHSQMPGYLEFLSEVIHTPWAIDDAEHNFVSAGESLGETPSSLRIATIPKDRAGSAEVELTRKSISHAVRPTWRSDAFDRLLKATASELNLPQESFSASVLDRDESTRDAFLKTFRESQIAVEAGGVHLREIASLIQKGLVSSSRPKVKDAEPDELEDIEVGSKIYADTDVDLRDWDEFMVDILGPAARWSHLTLSSKGKIGAAGNDMVSVAFGPNRLNPRDSEKLDYFSSGEEIGRPVEMVVRIDFALSLDPEETGVFEPVLRGNLKASQHSSAMEVDSSDGPPELALDAQEATEKGLF